MATGGIAPYASIKMAQHLAVLTKIKGIDLTQLELEPRPMPAFIIRRKLANMYHGQTLIFISSYAAGLVGIAFTSWALLGAAFLGLYVALLVSQFRYKLLYTGRL